MARQGARRTAKGLLGLSPQMTTGLDLGNSGADVGPTLAVEQTEPTGLPGDWMAECRSGRKGKRSNATPSSLVSTLGRGWGLKRKHERNVWGGGSWGRVVKCKVL